MKKFFSFLMSFLLLFSLFQVQLANATEEYTITNPTNPPTPILINGNFPNVKGYLMFKIETLKSDKYKIPGTDKFIDVRFNDDNTINFQSELPISYVFVKGGDGGYLYHFNPATDPTLTYIGLHPLENKVGYKTISHVCFYYNLPEASFGQINVVKTINTESGLPHANVPFTLYKKISDNNFTTITNTAVLTNANGSIFFDKLETGTYKLVENPPSGYFQSSIEANGANVSYVENGIIFEVTKGNCTEVRVVNTQFASLRISKSFKTPNLPNPDLSKITFTLTPQNPILPILTETLDSNGIAFFQNIIPGTYTLTESSLTNYLPFESQVLTFTAGEEKPLDIKNTYECGKIQIKKYVVTPNSKEEKPFNGVTFTITPLSNNNGVTTLDTRDGIAETQDLLPGKYKITETKCPNNSVDDYTTEFYLIDSNGSKIGDSKTSKEYIVDVMAGELVFVKVVNTLTPASVTVTKTMLKAWLDGSQPQEVTFKLKRFNSDGKYEQILIDTTKIDGNIASLKFKDLLPGQYELEEVVPDGFTSNNPIQRFELKPGDNKVLQVVNTCDLSAIKIIKTYKSSEGDEGVLKPGITFRLYQNNKLIREDTTKENGELLFIDLASGAYELEEVVPDDCTSSLNGKVKIELPANTVKTINVTNTLKPASVTVIKSMFKAWLEGSQPQEVTFKLKRLNSDGNCEQLLIDTTKIAGNIASLKFKDLLPGQYELEEVVPDGFTSNNPIQRFELKAGEDKVLRVVNTCDLSAIKIIKTYKESENDEGILKAGFKFRLYQDNEVIKEGVTGENGELLFTDLAPGIYELEEVDIPDDCTCSLNGKVTIELGKDTVKTISVVNTKNTTVPVINPKPLPKTGEMLDFESMLGMGILCLIAGLYITYRKI